MAARRSQLAGRTRSSAVQPTTVLLTAAIVAAVLIMAAVLFGARWTPSSDAGTWVSAGVRVVMNAGRYPPRLLARFSDNLVDDVHIQLEALA